MSYKVNGGGAVIPKTEVPENVLKALWSAEFFVEDAPDGGLWLTFDDSNFNDQVEPALKELAKYVQSGKIDFTGEDAEYFRYVFENGKVYYEDGKIVYERKFELE